MSIDSDLNAGLIDEAEASGAASNWRREAEFYGAMDGASRFTQRDAVASILITAINIIAGFLIGVLQHGMDLSKALADLHRPDHRRRPGDGHSGADDLDLGRPDRHARQLRRAAGRGISASRSSATRSRCCWRPACCARWRSCPACPSFRFCCWAAGRARPAGECAAAKSRPRRRPVADAKPAAAKENLESLLRVEPLAIEVGLGLVGLVEGGAGVAAAAPHLRDPPAAGHRSRLSAAAGARHRQPLAAQPGIRDLAQRAWRYRRYELPQGCELAIPAGRRGAAGRRPADARTGLRHERVVGAGGTRGAGAAARATRWSIRSACWARICPN